MNSPSTIETVPNTAGTPFGGGYYVDRFFLDGQLYALVCSEADGDLEESRWNASDEDIEGARSYNDGLRNTNAMAAAGSAIARTARDSRLQGFDDWYIPSRLEALILRCAAQPAPIAFKEDWYWTSTQHESDSDYAWCQSFNWGGQSSSRESSQFRVRLVRSVVI